MISIIREMYEAPHPYYIIRSNRRRTSIGAQYDDDRWMTKSFRNLFDSVLWVVSNSSLFCFLSVFPIFLFIIIIIQQIFLIQGKSLLVSLSRLQLSRLSLSLLFSSLQLRSTMFLNRWWVTVRMKIFYWFLTLLVVIK